MKYKISYVLVSLALCANAQTKFEFNALLDTELSVAGSESHYYYNEIHEDFLDTRFGISQLNAIGELKLNEQWSFNARLLLERDLGQELDKFSLPQLNVQWLSKERKVGLTVGTFINPFGYYNEKQLSTERNFISLPLSYTYYVNVSDKIGFLENMGEINQVWVDGNQEWEWGTTNLYYGGYSTGAMFSWNIKPSKVNWKLALVSGASNSLKRFTDPLNIGIISKFKFQPTYYWEQGVSFSYGTFFRESEANEQLDDLGDYTQTLIGTDIKLGTGRFEFIGEVIGAFYQVPQFNFEDMTIDSNTLKISNISANLDIKYEPDFIPGSYIAYRIDHIGFSKLDIDQSPKWDNDVVRHSAALGYDINEYLRARVLLSTQNVNNWPTWVRNQRTFRMVVTAHF